MGSITNAGSALFISAAAPAGQTTAAFAALTWTEIGSVESLGELGAKFEMVTFTPLKGAVEKHKGSPNYGSFSAPMAVSDGDAGQALLAVAADDQTSLYSFRVDDANGTPTYFQGRVFGFPKNFGNANSILMATPSIEVCTKPVI